MRKKSDKKGGGQAGHAGHALEMAETVDQVVTLAPVTHGQHGQADVRQVHAHTIERRQVIDVHQPRADTTEDQGEWTCCPHCQRRSRATFPPEVKAPIHSGPRVAARAVSVQVSQRLPQASTAESCTDLLGVSLSQATLGAMQARAARELEPVEGRITDALLHTPVWPQDETGLSVEGKR